MPQIKTALRAGVNAALTRFGIDADDERNRKIRTLATTTAAGALPWAGLIGQTPLGQNPHDNAAIRVKKLRNFLEQLQEGDVLLSGDPSAGLAKDLLSNKGVISLATGTPEQYHASIVRATNPLDPYKHKLVHSAQHFGMDTYAPDASMRADHLTLLRPRLTKGQIQEFLANVDEDLSMTKKIETALQGKTDATTLDAAKRSIYSLPQAVSGGVKELFVPKTHAREDVVKSHSDARNARRQFNTQALETHLKALPPHTTPDVKQLAALHGCASGTCSSFIAGALPAGTHVLPNKLVSDILPSDLLKNRELYEPVATYSGRPRTNSDKLLAHAPTGVRALGSLATMGAAYGLNKLYDKWRTA